MKKNVKIYDNIFGDQYLKMLSESKALIVSLGNNNVSSGQLSFLNGLKAGKAIIVIENEAIIDYAKNEVNCLVVEKNKNVFSKYIKGLTSQKIKEIEEKSYDYFIENYTISKMAERIGEVINEDVN